MKRLSQGKTIVTGLSGRYATALFDLAVDAKALDSVNGDLAKLGAALAESADLKALTTSPRIKREDAAKAVQAVAHTLGLSALTSNFLGVLAQNRRLGTLGGVIGDFQKLLAAHRAEQAAEVTSAHALNAEQITALKAKLKAGLGTDVTLITKVDPSILGGLIVKVGSKLIDSSLKTKLDGLSLAMKGL
jgi:F-type H+-transporting ATPase subunit delta